MHNAQQMACYSIWPGNWIFVKESDFCLFAKSMDKDTGKNLRGKCSQKTLTKKDITDALKANSKIFIQKTAEATGVLIGYKIGNKNYKNLQKLHQWLFYK